MERIDARIRRATCTAVTLLALTVAAVAEAQVRCGDVIGPNAKVTLDAELANCPAGAAALTVIGPATLDLNGQSVSCFAAGSATATGIVVVGKRATVRNGTVQLCASGIRVLGEGGHRIENMIVATSSGNGAGGFGDGIVVESDGNKLIDNKTIQNHGDGYLIRSDRNLLSGNRAFINDAMGFNVVFGERNTLKKNLATGNGGVGFRLSNGRQNTLTGNTSSENQGGFFGIDQVKIKLTSNVARANLEDGIAIFHGSGGRLTRNTVERNGDHGIVVAAANKTVVTRNTALNNGHAGPNRFDLVDIGQVGCGTNRWIGNVFVTADPSECIR